MAFSRDSGVSAVLESSFTPCKLRFCARRFLALTKKSSLLEAPLSEIPLQRSLRVCLSKDIVIIDLA